MTDKENNTEAEYKFSEDDTESLLDETKVTASEAFTGQTEKKNLLSTLFTGSNKRLVLGVGIVLIGIVALKIMRHTGQSITTPLSSPPAPSATQNPTMALSSEGNLSLSASTSSTANQTVSDNVMPETSSQLEQSFIQAARGKIMDLSNSVQNLSDSQEKIKSAIQLLATKMEAMSVQIEKLAAMQSSLKKGPVAKQIFFLRAIDSGRAWIQAENGIQDTVSLGSTIPGYGTVTAIDPVKGQLTTSSGKKITYNVYGN